MDNLWLKNTSHVEHVVSLQFQRNKLVYFKITPILSYKTTFSSTQMKLDRLQFEFTMIASNDGTSNVLAITSRRKMLSGGTAVPQPSLNCAYVNCLKLYKHL